MAKCELVKNAMLAVQRYPWEQGVCMQALYEYGDVNTAFAMAHDAVLRQKPDGRLAVINDNIAVTDPAANGEVVYRAYQKTGDSFFGDAAKRMLSYLMEKAPRTKNGTLCHNEISFVEGYSPDQIWVDSIYMAPAFLAVMGEKEEAVRQVLGMISYLEDPDTGLMYHIYDAGQECFLRKKLWATGNGWALLGIARVIDEVKGDSTVVEILSSKAIQIIEAMLPRQCEDGRFHDFLDEKDTFLDGASAMMMAATIYRGMVSGWLPKEQRYIDAAELVAANMDSWVDDFGIIRGVCGCPDFDKEGTSAESMAAYLMMHAWRKKFLA